jgi:hypothetical protein
MVGSAAFLLFGHLRLAALLTLGSHGSWGYGLEPDFTVSDAIAFSADLLGDGKNNHDPAPNDVFWGDGRSDSSGHVAV